ncbi:hypothetical protein TNCV_2772911 [Trichonephila clavipes]|nr:hypothetical protein TNCV_2772911 [Trichonephila clavipes]
MKDTFVANRDLRMADCPSNGRQLFVSVLSVKRVISPSRVLICCCVNVVTSVPVGYRRAGSEASSVRTGQWGSPIGR